jgi:hypothetical protein
VDFVVRDVPVANEPGHAHQRANWRAGQK